MEGHPDHRHIPHIRAGLRVVRMRWSIEVCFKECKQYLRLEGNQAQYFNSQIAHVSICLMQYLLLSLAKRISSYETLGGLFRGAKADLVEITLYERILLVLKDTLEEFTIYMGFPNKAKPDSHLFPQLIP